MKIYFMNRREVETPDGTYHDFYSSGKTLSSLEKHVCASAVSKLLGETPETIVVKLDTTPFSGSKVIERYQAEGCVFLGYYWDLDTSQTKTIFKSHRTGKYVKRAYVKISPASPNWLPIVIEESDDAA